MPEFGRPAVHISESIVGPPGLTPPFGCLLWAARSAVACLVCLNGVTRPGRESVHFSPDGGPPVECTTPSTPWSCKGSLMTTYVRVAVGHSWARHLAARHSPS